MEIGQTITKARFREKRGIRNMVLMTIMNEAVLGKHSHPISNFDATQFIMTDNSREVLVTIKKNADDCVSESLGTAIDDS